MEEGHGQNWHYFVSKEIREWAVSEIRKQVKFIGAEYDDNYRIAEVGNPEQEEHYADFERQGCCGFHKFERIGPDEKKYVLGFNYGH